MTKTFVVIYLALCREHNLHALLHPRQRFETDFCSFDGSRVSKFDVLSVSLDANAVFQIPPLIIMEDLLTTASLNFSETLAQGIMLKGRQPQSRKHLLGASTLALAFALVHSLFAVMPLADMTVYAPSVLGDWSPESERHFDAATGWYYIWDKKARSSQWALPPELRLEWQLGVSRVVRILGLPCDLGSNIWSLFNFFVTFRSCRLRSIYHPDSSHRKAAVFVNSLRANKIVFETMCACTIVAKFLRAPYGGPPPHPSPGP